MTLSVRTTSPEPVIPVHQKRLLIVEDECIVAFDLSVVLEELGYAVVGTASSADEALQLADEQCPDLVLMDINIAGRTDGIQAGCLLRARHQMALVYLTANVDAATLGRALTTEPTGYLVKPYNEHSLRTTIEVAFHRHEAEQAVQRSHEQERRHFEQKYSDMINLARRLRRDATCDPLTGLHNRRHLQHVMKREVSFAQRDGHPVALILLDLDRFKQLNDSFGHPVGDAALRAVADLLRARIRIYDIACRYGGEEIVIVVPGASAAGAASLAEDLRSGITGLRIACESGGPARFTASFGVASFPEHGWDSDSVLRAADQALYQAKAAGRDRVVTAIPGEISLSGAQPPATSYDPAVPGQYSGHGAGTRSDRVLPSELETIDDVDD